MSDRYGYFEGTCLVCHEQTSVRTKNLYTIGSEGTDMCHKCEMKVVRFVQDLMRQGQLERKTAYMEKRRQRDV